MGRIRTIMAETGVSPFLEIEPGCPAETVEASQRASKERLEYMTGYSGGGEESIKGEDREEKETGGPSGEGREVDVQEKGVW